jgi:hypothetical protein
MAPSVMRPLNTDARLPTEGRLKDICDHRGKAFEAKRSSKRFCGPLSRQKTYLNRLGQELQLRAASRLSGFARPALISLVSVPARFRT